MCNGCQDREEDMEAIMDAVRRSTVQIVREVERRYQLGRKFDVKIIRLSHQTGARQDIIRDAEIHGRSGGLND
jgi:phosphoribosyl-dephospho-CoA transferase